MPVGEMLQRMKSKELTEWLAFEQHSGPLGHRYSDELLAAIHEQTQQTNHLLGGLLASWGSGKNEVNPPEKIPRPHQLFKRQEPEDDPDVVDLDTLIALANQI